MRRIALAGAGAAVVLAAGSTHTLHLATSRLQFVDTTSTTFVESDAVSRAGKKAGYESISCNDGGHQIVCLVTIALKGGVLLGHLAIPITSSATTDVTGRITGGLGAYNGDKGSVSGTITGKRGTLTVKYHS
jgi:hypothetical protein